MASLRQRALAEDDESLAIAGHGPVSVDHFVLKAMRPDRPPSDYGA